MFEMEGVGGECLKGSDDFELEIDRCWTEIHGIVGKILRPCTCSDDRGSDKNAIVLMFERVCFVFAFSGTLPPFLVYLHLLHCLGLSTWSFEEQPVLSSNNCLFVCERVTTERSRATIGRVSLWSHTPESGCIPKRVVFLLFPVPMWSHWLVS